MASFWIHLLINDHYFLFRKMTREWIKELKIRTLDNLCKVLNQSSNPFEKKTTKNKSNYIKKINKMFLVCYISSYMYKWKINAHIYISYLSYKRIIMGKWMTGWKKLIFLKNCLIKLKTNFSQWTKFQEFANSWQWNVISFSIIFRNRYFGLPVGLLLGCILRSFLRINIFPIDQWGFNRSPQNNI